MKKITIFLKENICTMTIALFFSFSLAIACGEKYLIPLFLANLFILVFAYFLKYLILQRRREANFELDFAYEIAQSLSCGFNLEQTYFQASRVLQKYDKSIFTLDEIRLDPSIMDVYAFKYYKDEIYSILCEEDFFYYSKGKYSLFLETVLSKHRDIKSKTIEMYKSKRTIMLAMIISSLIMILFSIFNVSLDVMNKYIALLPVSATTVVTVFFEEIYEKISG